MELVISVEHQLSSREEVLARLKAFSKREEMKRLIQSRLKNWQEEWKGNPGGRFSFSFKGEGKEHWQGLGEISFLSDSPGMVKLHLNLPQIDGLDKPGVDMAEDIAKNLLAAVLAPAWHQEKKRRVMRKIVPITHPLSPEEALRRLQGFSVALENCFPDKVSDSHDVWEGWAGRFRFNWLDETELTWRVSGMVHVYRHSRAVHLNFNLLSRFAITDEKEFRKAVAAAEETVKSLLGVGG